MITDKRARSVLRTSIVEATLTSSAFAVADYVFAVFFIAGGLGNATVGWLSTTPLFIACAAQWLLTRIISFDHYKSAYALAGLFQGLALLVFSCWAILGIKSVFAWTILLAIYWTAQFISIASWNTCMLPRLSERASTLLLTFRAKRTYAIATLTLFGTMMLLNRHGADARQCAIPLALAGLLRIFALGCVKFPRAKNFNNGSLIGKRSVDGSYLFIFFVAFHGAGQIAAPYFPAYLLREVKIDYLNYAYLLTTLDLAKWAAMPFVRRVIESFGPKITFIVASVALAPAMSLWLVSNSFFWLMALQIVGGILWACYETSFPLLLRQTFAERQLKVNGDMQLGQWSASVAAAQLGRIVLRSPQFPFGGYQATFITASLVRAGCVATFVYAARSGRKARQ